MVLTRSRRLRSLSLPPPHSPGLTVPAVSNDDDILTDVDNAPSGDVSEGEDQPAIINNDNDGAVAQDIPNDGTKVEEVLIDLGPTDDVEIAPSVKSDIEMAPCAEGNVDNDGYIMPIHPAKRADGIIHRPCRYAGNNNKFILLSSLNDDSKAPEDFDWSKSSVSEVSRIKFR